MIRGEAGIGKTALMQYLARQASGCQVRQVAGVRSEMDLPFAVLHQLCAPVLDRITALPDPQQEALRIAFGLARGNAPDRFLVGLATLSLLSEVAAELPLVCLVDDAQWLDEASSQVLGFVGRRLLAEPVLLLYALRDEADERLMPALPEMTLGGLTETDARALLRAVVPGRLDERVRDRIIAETHGNPLVILELARRTPEAELGGGFADSTKGSLSDQLQSHYVRRVEALPEQTQCLMLLAAADPTGNETLLWRAARSLGLDHDAANAAQAQQLLEMGTPVRFRHPLIRSAAYAAGSPEGRRTVHEALAAATDAQTDPERRVWHLAAAATGHDEGVAAALEEAATRTQARAGLAAAAAFLQRSAALTAEPERRASRALAAAHAHLHAGALDTALALVAQAEADAVTDLQHGRVQRLRAQIAWVSSPRPVAPVELVQAAARLEPLDPELARDTYLDAWLASFVAGRLAEAGGQLPEVCAAARSAVQVTQSHQPSDLLLDGLATVVTDGLAAAAPSLRRAVDGFLDDPDPGWLKWGGSLVSAAAMSLWDFDNLARVSARQVELARASGALAPLTIALSVHGMTAAWRGDLDEATSLLAEGVAVAEATGTHMFPGGSLLLAAYRGRPSEASPLMATTVSNATARGEGIFSQFAHWTAAILHNGLGHYSEALVAAEEAVEETDAPHRTSCVLPEVVEAAVRSGNPDLANDAMTQLSGSTIAGSDWASGIEARCHALLSDGQGAEQLYSYAIERLGRTPLRPELARAQLLYGEWLRRQNRRTDARQQLRTAYELFTSMGTEAFAERARRELVATGGTVRKREPGAESGLTPQEEHIARLARDGRTNPEIGAELFLSARTVEWHLSKIFTKLGITSRRGLHDAMPTRGKRTPRGSGI